MLYWHQYDDKTSYWCLYDVISSLSRKPARRKQWGFFCIFMQPDQYSLFDNQLFLWNLHSEKAVISLHISSFSTAFSYNGLSLNNSRWFVPKYFHDELNPLLERIHIFKDKAIFVHQNDIIKRVNYVLFMVNSNASPFLH